jgi:threonine dehydratase
LLVRYDNTRLVERGQIKECPVTSLTPLTPADVARRSAEIAPALHEHLDVTPLVRFDALSAELEVEVLVKCEFRQRTGSFKARGSLAKSMTLTPRQREAGVVTASTGNHGLGVVNAMRALGGRAVVFVPANASAVKVDALRRLGVELHVHDADAGVVEGIARAHADEHGLVYLAPYNDPDVIAGQGTAGLEIVEQLAGRDLDALFVNVGGGGLMSGVASSVKQHHPGVRVYGASPRNDAGMIASVEAGKVVQVPTELTLSDGSAGNLEDGSITVELCADLVDEWVSVSEKEIATEMAAVIDTEHVLIEGAAGVAFAAARRYAAAHRGGRIVVLACGANIGAATLADALRLAAN